MKISRILGLPLWALQVFTGTKSFADNPVLGNRWLNERGLHRTRARIAAQMADWRRRRLATRLDPSDRESFDANGVLVKSDFLPAAEFLRLKQEILEGEWDTLEMRQGPALTRHAPLDRYGMAKRAPGLSAFMSSPRVLDLIRYAAAADGQPFFSLQTIVVDAGDHGHDPQCVPHMDTFHPCAKAWFFLHDVGADEGPFFYVPASHRRTQARLDWEQRMSLSAAAHENRYHAKGSLRISVSELTEIGFPAPVPLSVRANTLVVADTSGFHGRTPSQKATTRIEIFAALRRSPFVPWLGIDLFNLPFIRDRTGSIRLDAGRLLRASGMRWIWPSGGRKRMDSGAHPHA